MKEKNGLPLEPECPRDEDLPPIVAEAFQNDETREAVYCHTARVLRRRVWARRTVSALVLAGVYAAGLATGQLGGDTSTELAHVPETAAPASAPAPEPKLDLAELLASADAVGRHLAALSPAERAHFYKTAGDWYLNVAGDPARAVTCYRQMLDMEEDLDLPQTNGSESWILANLRYTRMEEVRHVQ